MRGGVAERETCAPHTDTIEAWAALIRSKRKWAKANVLPLTLRRYNSINSARLVVPELVARTRFDPPLRRCVGAMTWTVKDKKGLRLTFRPFTTDLHFIHEIWDFHIYDPPTATGTRVDTIIDIGAHIGLFTLYASLVRHARQIFAYEPDPTNFDLLQRNVAANQVRGVRLQREAVVGRPRKVLLYRSTSHPGEHSVVRKTGDTLPVSSTTLSEILQQFGLDHCDLLKMDCEGAELEIIMESPDASLIAMREIVLEFHLDVYGTDGLDDIVRRLRDLEFEVYVFESSENEGIAYAKRR